MNDGGCTKNQETGNNNRIIQQQSLQHNVGSSSAEEIDDIPAVTEEKESFSAASLIP